MMSIELFLTYIAACIAVVIVPGPTVTVIIANSMRHGARAGLLNVAGTQLGLAIYLGVLVMGLASVMKLMGHWFDIIRLIGAAYLVWLGIKLWLSNGKLATGPTKPVKGGFFLQGLFVVLANPKVLLFFGAFIPQFFDKSADYSGQLVLLGIIFMVVAALLDGGYAVLSGGLGNWLSLKRVRLLERISGTFLIGGGIWLALVRR